MVLRHPYSSRPIAIFDPAPTTADIGTVPVERHGPFSDEALVDLTEAGLLGRNYYAVADGSNPPYCQPLEGAITALLARQSVADKLFTAEAALQAYGLRLFICDAYRPIQTQRGLWDFIRARIAADAPGLSPAQLDRETAKFASDPRAFDRDDPSSWPLHASGGAVDTILADARGEALAMGAGFDEMTPAAATAYFETLLQKGAIGPQDLRLVHRRILYWTLCEAGFTNYPHEYWHYDFGDQMYVLCRQAQGDTHITSAIYPYAELSGG